MLCCVIHMQFRDTNRESRCRTRNIREDIVSTNSKPDDLKQSAVNTELFNFSGRVFETPNERGSIYYERMCEREFLPEYL